MIRKTIAGLAALALTLTATVAFASGAGAADCDRFYQPGGSYLGNYPGTADGHLWNHCQAWYSQGSLMTVNDWSGSWWKVGTFTQGGTTFCLQLEPKFQMDTYYHAGTVTYDLRLVTYSGGACTSTLYYGTTAQVNVLVSGQIQQVSTADDYSTITSTSNYVTVGSTLAACNAGPGSGGGSTVYGSPTWAETGWGTVIPAFYRSSVLATYTPSGGTQQTIGASTFATWVG